MPRDQVLISDYSNRLSGAASLRGPSLKHSLLENHLDPYFINFVYFSNALERPIHKDMFLVTVLYASHHWVRQFFQALTGNK